MVIEGYQPRKVQLPASGKPENFQHCVASATDRLAAAVLDWVVILTPVLVLTMAPLRRQMTESLLFEAQSQFAVAMIWSVLLGLLVVFLYQTICTYKWGGSLGKLAFGLRVVNVWHQSRPDLETCALRSVIWIAEVLFLGLPWLSVLSNPLRRTMHDKLSDTVVVTTRRHAMVTPGYFQMAFVRGIYTAIFSAGLVIVVVSAMEVVGHLESEEKLMDWINKGSSSTDRCEEVSALDEKEEHSSEVRLQTAMELFAGGLISQSCLEQEAGVVLNQNDNQSALAYLAMAFASSEDADRSNEYLAEACKLSADSEACQMTSIVQHWSSEDWGKVAELFDKLPESASPHVLVWKIRYLMRQGQYEQALSVIARLSGRSQLADYLIPERVKALWRVNHFEESRLVATTAFETLKGPERANLSGWLCYEELVQQCPTITPISCNQLVKDANSEEVSDLQPSGWLAMILIKEKCSGQAKSSEYAAIEDMVGPGAIQQLVANLKLWAHGKSEQAKTQMADLILDEQQPEMVRAEGLRRLIVWSEKGEELKPWIKHWQNLKPGPRRTLGPILYRALKSRGQLNDALVVGQKLLNENRADLEINRDLVVTAYQLGRRQEAWAFLKSYNEQSKALINGRSPAAVDQFVAITRLLNQGYGEK